jgi:hypothetical protein
MGLCCSRCFCFLHMVANAVVRLKTSPTIDPVMQDNSQKTGHTVGLYTSFLPDISQTQFSLKTFRNGQLIRVNHQSHSQTVHSMFLYTDFQGCSF